MDLIIWKFSATDADKICLLLKRNFLEVNSQDYPLEQIEQLAAEYCSEQTAYAHTYVTELDNKGIGTGTICSFRDSQKESIILSLFIHPEFHSQGIIMKHLEQDEFYLHLGYQVKTKEHIEDENSCILMKERV